MHHQIERICIVGAGFMGTEIATRALQFGYQVKLFDVNPQAIAKSKEKIDAFLNAMSQFQANGQESKINRSGISYFNAMKPAVESADLVIEAVSEQIDIKQSIFRELDALLPPTSILATNSSSIPISRIETVAQHKERLLNLHFYAPIDSMHFVELMRGKYTIESTIYRASEWIKTLNCIPMLCKKESIGFIFNRVWHAARREAMKVWQEGIADFREVDKAWMLFTGMPVGPFGLMDLIGLDVVYSVQNLYFEESKDPYFKPPQALKEMVDRGEFGFKAGQGFYRWPDAECLKPDFLSLAC